MYNASHDVEMLSACDLGMLSPTLKALRHPRDLVLHPEAAHVDLVGVQAPQLRLLQ